VQKNTLQKGGVHIEALIHSGKQESVTENVFGMVLPAAHEPQRYRVVSRGFATQQGAFSRGRGRRHE
jgi:hypothetical protein